MTYFQQQAIEMQLVVRSGYTWSITITVNHLAKEDSSCFIFVSMKSKVNDRERLEMQKYCSNERKHTTHKETR